MPIAVLCTVAERRRRDWVEDISTLFEINKDEVEVAVFKSGEAAKVKGGVKEKSPHAEIGITL